MAQALAAQGYLQLPSESDQVQRVYYYDFDGQNAGWDSGLVNLSPSMLGPHGYGTPRTAWCVLHNFAQGESPTQAASDALRAGSTCDSAQQGDAPLVDTAYLTDPLTKTAAPAVSPGDAGREVMLTFAERVRALAALLAPGQPSA
jgi:hypothetical protein